MEIGVAREQDFIPLQELWSVVFEEEPEFLKRFFTQRFQADHIIVARKEGVIVSALHALSSTYTQNSLERPCIFIVGAATYEEHRKQGIMGKLLAYTQQHFSCPITLFPAVRPFYEANGYLTTSSLEKYHLSPKEALAASYKEKAFDWEDYDALYRAATQKEGALMRDEKGWDFLVDGYSLACVEGAYAFIKDGLALEAMATGEQEAAQLLSLLHDRGVTEIQVLPSSPFTTLLSGTPVLVPMGMSTEPSMLGVYIAEQY